jgi:hypothetical protein
MTHENPAKIVVLPPEERLRLDAAEKLGAMMALSLRLLDDCGMQAAMGKGDAVGALNAAARLIKSNADVTHALVRAAQGETRHRSINETRTGTLPGLNPNFPGSPNKGALEELKRRLNRLNAAREGIVEAPDEDDDDDDADDDMPE